MTTRFTSPTAGFFMVLCALVLCHPSAAAAGDTAEASPFSLSTDFGISFHSIMFDISDPDTLETFATLEGTMVPLPYLAAQSRMKRFGEGDFGYLWRYSLWIFSADRQSDPFSANEARDHDTSVDGWFLYAMPVLVWEPVPVFRVGMGYGLGYFSVKGDALIYDPYPSLVRIKYDLSQWAAGGYFLMEYDLGDWFVGVQGGFLWATEGPYEYTVYDTYVTIGYRLEF